MGGEIDIMEMNGGIYGNTVVGTYSWSKNCSAGEPHPQPAPANCTCGCGCDLFFGKGATGTYRKTRKTHTHCFDALTPRNGIELETRRLIHHDRARVGTATAIES